MNKSAVIRHSRRTNSRFIKTPVALSVSFPMIGSTQNSSTGYFFALVHEVRNPLNNIKLACDMLNSTNLDEEQRACLNIVMRGANRINDMISTLLKPKEIEAVNYELYSLRQLLEEVLIIAKDRILLKKIEVSREYAEPEHEVSLDIEKMKIALINIVNNAIDAMPSGRGELKVVIRSAGQLSSIEIHDNGIGISEENLKRLFEPYFTNKAGGMGLGLYATLNILRANHARVEVRSEEGVGTCFIVSFVGR